MISLLRIFLLKRRARRLALLVDDRLDKVPCGLRLLRHMSRSTDEACRQFDRTMDELAKLDPNAPTFRFGS